MKSIYIWFSLVFAIGFALIHYSSKYWGFIKDQPQSRFLSFAGGIAVSYVFIHLLPELNHYQRTLEDSLKDGVWRYVENHIHLIAMIGLAVFYGLERLVKVSKRKLSHSHNAHTGVFWIHMAFFFVYNAVIGYLLIREDFHSVWGMFYYFIALSIHFITNDRALRRDHKKI